ncbi:DedA family protein [Candidatus Woesearchaeota archaeon]|nr:DedA family protein [Candidatus Woesearchaeota archaeon]
MVFGADLFGWATSTISMLGYPGILILMTLESIILPMPSEAILPFAGYLVSIGELNLWLVTIFATIGSLIGSCLAYAVGKYGGLPFLEKYGRYFLVDHRHLHKAHSWFAKYGDKTVFFGRLLPVVRHVISIPAGIAEMRFSSFLLYTATGAFLWNLTLTFTGYILGEHWQTITMYTAPFEGALVILVILLIAWYIFEAVEKRTQVLKRINARRARRRAAPGKKQVRARAASKDRARK